ncbi:putative transmembrane protein [Toxoplasma gondii TgCatPRC2]|uniref:Putative transmembrane protein n=1 Tax=Toxoplasma gondii TgCatPRC2 TaxID=1130821 RepID=A0A151GZM4_TOXGO|nr:putative transmembrane protein [Toxoplasma gondii TgCatPRC2]
MDTSRRKLSRGVPRLLVAALLAVLFVRVAEGGVRGELSRGLSPAFRSASNAKKKQEARNWAGEDSETVAHLGSATAEKVLNTLVRFATQVGRDMKNGVLQKVSQVLTSNAYKRAKHFVVRTDVKPMAVRSDLWYAGYGMRHFLHAYAQVPPAERPAVYKWMFETNASLRRVRRKYLHLGTYLAPEATFEALQTLRNIVVEVQTVLQRTAWNDEDEAPKQSIEQIRSQSRQAERVFEAVFACFARALSTLSFVISKEDTILPELGTYGRQMVPRLKSLFTASWRLSKLMPPRVQLEVQRTLVDYLNDFQLFDRALGNCALHILASTDVDSSYDPNDDYFAAPEISPSVLLIDDDSVFDTSLGLYEDVPEGTTDL